MTGHAKDKNNDQEHRLTTPTQDDENLSDSGLSESGSALSVTESAMSGSGSGSGSTSMMSGSAISVPSALRKGKYSSSPSVSPLNSTVNSKENKRRAFFDDDDSYKAGVKSQTKTVSLSSPSSVRGADNVKVLDTLEEIPAYISLPNGLVIGDTGLILARCSRFSLFFKKNWREFVWVHCKPVTILLFRSVEDAQQWMTTKYLRNDQKRKLIKFAIDFDTMGILNGNYMKEDRSQKIPRQVMTYNMTDVRSKRTKIDGSIRHQFFVERWSNVETRVEVSFSSSDVMEVKCIRKVIRKCIKKASKTNSKNKRVHDKNDSIAYSTVGSEVSDATGTTKISDSSYQLSAADSYANGRRATRKFRINRKRV